MKWVNLVAEIADLADTAALVSHLDLVITVDSAVAHLAGAMGKPVWILTRFAPDWRWMLKREDSPWYPTARLFRQSGAGGLDSGLSSGGVSPIQACENLLGGIRLSIMTRSFGNPVFLRGGKSC